MPSYQETGYRMNERLTYLWEQANIRYSVYETAKPREERKTIPDIFSQMIVRECMEQVFYTIEDEEQDNISGSIRDRITQHFGVEE
jgi:hypothetical protein